MNSWFDAVLLSWLVMACSANLSREAVMIEISHLLRSSSKDVFTSDNDYFKAHEKLLTTIVSESIDKCHPFVVSLFHDCKHCHDTFLDDTESTITERYRVVSKEKAIFYGSIQEIESLRARFPHSIDHYFPLLSEAKIDNSLRSLMTTPIAEGGCDDVDNFPVEDSRILDSDSTSTSTSKLKTKLKNGITVVVAPLSEKDFKIFIEDMKVMQSQEFSFLFEFKELLPNVERSAHVEVEHCQDITLLASLLSQRREILWIEKKHDISVSNKWAKGICQSGSSSSTPMYSSNLTGENQIIGVADTGLDLQSCYFIDPNEEIPYDTINKNHRKVVTYISYQDMVDDSVNGHGTHVCGSLLGKCIKDYGEYKSYNGVAYNAKIAFYDIGLAGSSTLHPPSNLESGLFGPMYSAGARIFSNSWGAPSDNTYNYLSVSVDRFMWNNPDALVIFAAGNDGPYTGSIDAPSTNKNGVAVGASLNDYTSWLLYGGSDSNTESNEPGSTVFSGNSMAFFSSRGPTADGRLKPDVMAPGWWITSAASSAPPLSNDDSTYMYNSSSPSHCTVKGMRGTSMSTPIVAGSAGLIREYFTGGYYPSGIISSKDSFIPSGALLKAMLIHSARPLVYSVSSDSSNHHTATTLPGGNANYPSNMQGYGRIELDNVLHFENSKTPKLYLFVIGAAEYGNKHYRSIRNGETERHTFYTTSDTVQPSIRITLAYTDYAGTSGSSRPLVNDLSIVVVDGSGTIVHRSQTSQQGESDSNNVKMILIDEPIPDTAYTAIISSNGNLAYTQPYALVMTGQILPVRQRTVRSILASIQNYMQYSSLNAGIAVLTISLVCFVLFVFFQRKNNQNKMKKRFLPRKIVIIKR